MRGHAWVWAPLVALPLCLAHFSDFYVGAFHDDAVYVLASRSLLGLRYADDAAPGSPPLLNYTPGYPLLLAAWTEVFGRGLKTVQLLSLLLTLAAVAAAARLAEKELSPGAAKACSLAVAVHPFLAHFSGTAMSEPAFLLFSLLFVLVLRARRAFFALGLLTGFAFLIRPAGLCLLAAALSLLLGERKPKAAFACFAGFFLLAAPWLARNRWILGTSLLGASRFGQEWLGLVSSAASPALGALSVVAGNAAYYAKLLGAVLLPFSSPFDWIPSGLAAAGLLLCAVVLQAARRRGPAGLVLFFSLLLCLLWVNQDARYIQPLIPLLLLSAFAAAQRLSAGARRALLAVNLACAALGHARCLLASPGFGAARAPLPAETFRWISESLPPGAVVASEFPARIYLRAGRKGVGMPQAASADVFRYELASRGATHLLYMGSTRRIKRAGATGEAEELYGRLAQKFALQEGRYKPVYRNDAERVRLFEVRGDPRTFAAAYAAFRSGLEALQQGKASEAEARFRTALKQDPDLLDCYDALAAALESRRRFKEAEELLRKAVARSPLYTLGHYRLGMLYLATARRPEARGELETALELAGRDGDAAMQDLARQALR